MRIVAGKHRGRPLSGPPGSELRPTSDRTRESLFNILTLGRLAERGASSPLDGALVLDAFAGTGALGLEALSRGANHVTFMENQAVALSLLRENIRSLEEEARTTVLTTDVMRPPRAARPCQIVLLDPPYNQGMAEPALKALAAAGWIAEGAIASVELMKAEPFDPPAGFEVIDDRRYGKARLIFLRYAPAGAENGDAD